MRALMLSTALAVALSHGARAEQRMVGEWLMKSEADAFSDESTNIIAMRMNDDMQGFALRCIDGELSLALAGPRYREGDIFVVKFRADKDAVIDTAGKAISDQVLQIELKPEMVKEMVHGKRYALRIMGDTQADFMFRAGRGAEQAIGEVTKACPPDKTE